MERSSHKKVNEATRGENRPSEPLRALDLPVFLFVSPGLKPKTLVLLVEGNRREEHASLCVRRPFPLLFFPSSQLFFECYDYGLQLCNV